jgi:histidine triad (HIT) family protein
MSQDCIFCAIAGGGIPSFRIFEDEFVFAFLDINPFSRGHTLVIPKRHVSGLLDADDETLAQTIARVRKIAAHIVPALGADGFNILQNNGEAAGQTVGHMHFHIVPRYGNAPVAFESAPGDMEELKVLAEKIRFQL